MDTGIRYREIDFVPLRAYHLRGVQPAHLAKQVGRVFLSGVGRRFHQWERLSVVLDDVEP
jgi:hypothetical protein